MYTVRTYSAWWISGLAVLSAAVLYAQAAVTLMAALLLVAGALALVAFTLVAKNRIRSARPASTVELYYVQSPF